MRVCQFRHIRDCFIIISHPMKKVKHFLKVVKKCKLPCKMPIEKKSFDKCGEIAYS